MVTRDALLVFSVPQAQSLKDKRQVARSLIDRARRKFNASIAEVDTQDAHQTLSIGIAVVSGNDAHALSMLNTIIQYMEETAAAELISVDRG